MIQGLLRLCPLAALVGYDKAVKETARLTDKRIDSVNEIIKFSDNSIIKMNDVINISSDIFNSIFEK